MIKIAILLRIWIAGIAVLMMISCKHDPQVIVGPGTGGDDCDTLNITYNNSVYPIFQTYCLSCHSGVTPEAGIDLTDYSMVAQLAKSGTLLGALRHEQGFEPMPPGGGKLFDCDILKIEIWVRDTTFDDPGTGGVACDPDTVYFQNTILPLLQSSCGTIGCHDPGTANEGIILTDYQSIMNSDVIMPGNPGRSEMYEVITETDPDKIMPLPPNIPLTAEQTAAIFKWIQQGALNNYCEQTACDTVNVAFSTTIWPMVQGRCFGCHSGPTPQGGISLDNYSNIAAMAATGALMGAIKHEPGFSAMPQNGAKLPDCNIAQFQKWINDGTPNN